VRASQVFATGRPHPRLQTFLGVFLPDAGIDGDQFKRHVFVALKGSWNRSESTGYKAVHVPFKDGGPEGSLALPRNFGPTGGRRSQPSPRSGDHFAFSKLTENCQCSVVAH
jgi:hypothetical protein